MWILTNLSLYVKIIIIIVWGESLDMETMRVTRKNRFLKRILPMLLAGTVLVTSGAGEVSVSRNPGGDIPPEEWPAFQELLEEGAGVNNGVMAGSIRTDLYQYYIAEYEDVVCDDCEKYNPECPKCIKGADKPDDEIVINMSDFAAEYDDTELEEGAEYIKGAEHDGEKDCLLWGNDLGMFEYDLKVEKSGIYNLEFLYQTLDPDLAHDLFEWDDDKSPSGKNNAIEIGIKISPTPGDEPDYPFSAARSIELDKYWQNAGAIQTLRGHEQMPLQVQNNVWINYHVKDKEGMFNQPYFFYLEKGDNKIIIEGIKVNGVAFKSMTFKNYPELVPYSEIKPTQEEINATKALTPPETNDIGSNTILMQGQTPFWRSTLELGPTSDRGTYLVEPSHHIEMRYNTIGGDGTWGKAGQAATWEFRVPEDGYYRISAKVKQNSLRGFYANRRVLINGEVPCEEFNSIKFPYKSNWYQKSFTDENDQDIYIYLTKDGYNKTGINYITLEAVPGEIGDVMRRLTEDSQKLSYYYRRILMVVGPDPDQYNDYRVDEQVPELVEEFERIRDSLRETKKEVERFSKGGSEASTLETMAAILDLCLKNTDRIPMRTISLRDNIGSLSAWIREASRQPLELDYIEIATVHEDFGNAKPNFFKQLLFLWNGFIGSFFEDYTKLDGEGEVGSLNVWVGLGRDQALVLKNLLGDYNRDNERNLAVSLNLVQGGIIEATLAGKGPDIALFIGADFPVQLAARDLTVDISQFDDYDQVITRFAEDLPTFFTYLDGVYGLPLTQNFPMMFYRTDILNDLGLDPPETWIDFKNAVAVLNRAYLECGLVPPLNPANLGSTIFEPGETFTMLQLQTGQGFYRKNEEGIYYETTFDTEESIEAFTMLTDFYTIYRFRQTFDPFTRFRTGEMPIVIMPYSFYNQVSAAAPEIKGLWDFRHVPGTYRTDENGEKFLDISASSAATCGLIFSKVENKEDAWDFLKWLTSDDVQTRFGQNMEAMLGPLGRYDTANKNALANLAWSARELRRLEEQRDAIVEIPMIPANYSATRHVKNAFRAVVNDNYLPRYALSSYNRDINHEIGRKNAELESHKK